MLDEHVYDPLTIAFAGCVCFVFECLHVFSPVKPSLWIGGLFAVPTIAYAAYKCIVVRRKLRAYRRGEEGERIVAKAIEDNLIPRGYKVIHDIQLTKDGKRFNIDHLVIGGNGVFAVETKNYTKPRKGCAKVTYDGKQPYWNGMPHNKNEADQAESAANDAKELIARKTGMSVDVRPVLCCVGWWAASSDLYGHPVLLVMEKTIGNVIPKVLTRRCLTEEEQKVIYSALI